MQAWLLSFCFWLFTSAGTMATLHIEWHKCILVFHQSIQQVLINFTNHLGWWCREGSYCNQSVCYAWNMYTFSFNFVLLWLYYHVFGFTWLNYPYFLPFLNGTEGENNMTLPIPLVLSWKLTLLPLVPHVCASELGQHASDNGLSPDR